MIYRMNVVYSTIAHFKAAGFRLIRILEYNWNSTLALESYCEFTAECKMIRLRLNMHEIKLRRLPSNTTACSRTTGSKHFQARVYENERYLM